MEKLRKTVNEIAYAQDRAKLSPLQRSFVPLLSFASTLYRIALSLRRALYHFGLFREHRLPVPVICVGNLTWGGNGKTPMVEFIAHWLADSGISPLILTRGYAGGDEAKMLQRHLLGRPVKIAIGANRAAIASSFLKEYGYLDPYSNNTYSYRTKSHLDSERIGAAILDDGMQHWSLQSDLKIVMVNGLMLWGNSQLLPLGPLREPLNALERADFIVLHHADLIPEQSLKDIELTVQEIKESLPIFFTRMAPSHFFDIRNINSKKPLTALSNTIVLCVSAIGSANAFVQGMEKLGAFYVDQLEFSDHHIFQPKDIEMIRGRLGELEKRFGTKPVVIITEKDYDRDPVILKQLDPFQVMALCSELQFIPHKGCTEDSFKKLSKELLEHFQSQSLRTFISIPSMAFASTSPSSSLLQSTISSHQFEVKGAVPLMRFGGSDDQLLVPSAAGKYHRRHCSVIPIFAESKGTHSISPLLKSEVEENIEAEDLEELAKQLENASPLEIMDKALEKFGKEIAIAFSGAEDVALIEYAKLTRRPFRVFSLDTGRLNPETYQFFDTVEKHYGIHIEYMFPDAVEVQAFVRGKGLFSFYEDGHQECCRVRKVRPLRRALKGLRSWITGQRKDQSPGTRAEIPIVQVDPTFEGKDGGIGSLVKWNPLANVEGPEIWSFLRALNVPINSLHSQGYISIGCEPCTRPVLPGQHEREGRWWWEDSKAKECGLHKGNIKQEEMPQLNGNGNGNGHSPTNGNATVADIFDSPNLVALSRTGIENLARLENRREPWIVVLYAPWCRFCQAMEASYIELAEELAGSGVKVAKFRADGDQKAYAQQELQLGSFPTIVFFPKHSSKPIRYPSEKRDVSSLMVFVNALR